MSYRKPLAERERALEDAFFRKENERLLEAMRSKESRERKLDALSRALGMDDPEIVDPLLEVGLRESNITALVVAPLICVAWADGILDNEERALIAKSATALGVESDSESAELLEAWLEHRPHSSLIDAWSAYVTELCETLGPEPAKRLRDDTMQRAKKIAGAVEKSFLRGGGPTDDERAILEKIEAAFAPASK